MTRLLALLALVFVSLSSWAQAWPAKPVRIIAPFAPGGSADTLGRIVAQKLGEALKESFVVENRPGAGGAIGSELVARAAPDGYTLVVSGVASHVIAPSLPRGTPYDPVRDFTHIALFGGPPAVLVVNPAVPAKDLHELVALLKKEPGKYSYGSPGNGTHGQLVAELFKQLAGVQMQHVPYKGASVAISDLMAGHIPVASTTLTTAAAQIHAGKARALALSSPARLPDYPTVPTYAEMGYQDLVATVWFSLSGPAGMPPGIVQRLNAEVRKALEAPDTRQRLRPEGIEPGTLDAREFTAFVESELKRWAPVVKASGAKTD
ncbi:MAG TPA: tripartite tricarboxylate transporter substrate binding protein [Burkholderiales bacterium]|nr:tripartite tricarboxylate transporter substrate binding protein [Burkholderiales bacterium]